MTGQQTCFTCLSFPDDSYGGTFVFTYAKLGSKNSKRYNVRSNLVTKVLNSWRKFLSLSSFHAIYEVNGIDE